MTGEESQHIERRRLADQVADRLMHLIAEGTFKAGDRLPSEPQLMRQFRVGRSSIREAVGALSLLGLVTVRPGQGTHVAPFPSEKGAGLCGLLALGPGKVRELVEARVELEGALARLAAKRASAAELAEIRRQHLNLKNTGASGQLINADLAFHTALAKASHNSVLITFFSEIALPVKHWMEQKARFDWGYDQVFEQHREILEALENRDADGAETALKHHLLSTGEKLAAALLPDHCRDLGQPAGTPSPANPEPTL